MARPKGSKNQPKIETTPTENHANPIAEVPSILAEVFRTEGMPNQQDILEGWVENGLACEYVQFSTKPVPVAKGKEPVWEMKLETRDEKYRVNSIFYTEHGVIFNAHSRLKLVPLANVAYVQPI